MDQPVQVCRVSDRYPSSAGQCCELSVARVERCKLGGYGKIFVLPRIVSQKRHSLDGPRCAIEDFEIEPIADTGLPAGAQISMVLGLDLSCHIQDHAPSHENLLQEFDRRQPAHW